MRRKLRNICISTASGHAQQLQFCFIAQVGYCNVWLKMIKQVRPFSCFPSVLCEATRLTAGAPWRTWWMALLFCIRRTPTALTFVKFGNFRVTAARLGIFLADFLCKFLEGVRTRHSGGQLECVPVTYACVVT